MIVSSGASPSAAGRWINCTLSKPGIIMSVRQVEALLLQPAQRLGTIPDGVHAYDTLLAE